MGASITVWKLPSPFRINALDITDQRRSIFGSWGHFSLGAANGRASFGGVSFYRLGCGPALNGLTPAFSMCRRAV